MFDLLQAVEATMKDDPEIGDARRWEWLCDSAKALVETPHFDQYPNWRARAWVVCADLHRINSLPTEEIGCLQQALSLNLRTPVKRRLQALEKGLKS